MPTAESSSAMPANRRRSSIEIRRSAVTVSMTRSMDITPNTGCSGSTPRIAAVTAAPSRSGSSSPVRTTIAISCEETVWCALYSSSLGGSAGPI
jgi:hypothetical protein